jgi:PHP family Zn ribbon phosphoesterase
MELLIKVGSNTDDRVQCLNPLCRYSFRDAAMAVSACPKCGSEYMQRRQDMCWQDGDIINARPDGWPWSPSERPRVVRLPDEEVQKLMTAEGVKSVEALINLLWQPGTETVLILGEDKTIAKNRRKYGINVSPESPTAEFKEVEAGNLFRKTISRHGN